VPTPFPDPATRPAAGEDLSRLVERAQTGDREAFELLLRRYEGKALAIARQMGLSHEDAQDAAQDAFLKLFRYLGRFRSGESFTNWFYRIVVHATYDHLRRRGAPTLRLTGDALAQAEEIPDPGRRAEGDAEARQIQESLLAALGCLSPNERAAFVLRELHGLDTDTVAAALRVSRTTVRRHTMNARQKLRHRLEARFPGLFGEER
jgi:RNA polymerase sigma-70 factor (ECF subfamily)